MIASLPMYDRPETAAAHDRLWQGIRTNLEELDAPKALTRGRDHWDDWQDPDLLLSQACSLPFRTGLRDRVTLVATPVHDLPCESGCYFSVFVARTSDERSAFDAFTGARFAVNSWDSQSGWAAPSGMASDAGFDITDVVLTGAHRASAEAVAAGHADIAALDAVSWHMMQRFDGFSNELKVVAHSPVTPALPYVTSKAELAEPLAHALDAAVAGLGAADRELLCLTGITVLPAAKYLDMPVPKRPDRDR